MKKIISDVVEEAEKLARAIPGTAARQIIGEKKDQGNDHGEQHCDRGVVKRQPQADDAYLQLAKADDRQKTTAEISYLQGELDELRRRKKAEEKQPAADVVGEKKRKEEEKEAAKRQAWWKKQKEETLWGVRKKRLKTERFRGVSG